MADPKPGEAPVIPDLPGGEDQGGPTKAQQDRENLRKWLAALGLELPTNLSDLSLLARKMEDLQEKSSQSILGLLQTFGPKGVLETTANPLGFAYSVTDQLENLSTLQGDLSSVANQFQNYAFEYFDELGSKDFERNRWDEEQRLWYSPEGNILDPDEGVWYNPKDGSAYIKGKWYSLDDPRNPIVADKTSDKVLDLLRQNLGDQNVREGIRQAKNKAQDSRIRFDAEKGYVNSLGQPVSDAELVAARHAGLAEEGAADARNPGRPQSVQDSFRGFRDKMQPAPVRQERFPTAREFLGSYNEAFDARLGQIGGLSPDVQLFAQRTVKELLLPRYTAALAGSAGGVAAFRRSSGEPFTGTSALAVARTPTNQKISNLIGASGVSIAGTVVSPGVPPESFLANELTADKIRLLYEGSREGAGRSGSAGGGTRTAKVVG